MGWYVCSNLYEWGNIVKAKSHKEAKKLYYKYGDEPGNWTDIRCRKLKETEYDEAWLEKHLSDNGVISYTPSCESCGSWTLKAEEVGNCPVCAEDSLYV